MQNYSEIAQTIPYFWSLNEIVLAPDDAIIFHLEIIDNDAVTGPKTAKSEERIARYPSLIEMFEEMEISEQQTENDIAEVMESVENIQESVEEMARELLKNPEMDWEDAHNAKQMTQAQQEVAQQLEEIAEQIESMLEKAEKQDLFSDELVQKFSELQQLFEDILTPEMKEALQKIQESVDKMDPQLLQEAMTDFATNLDELNKTLDRMFELFQRIQIEEEMNRITKQLEEMLLRESAILDNIEEKNTFDIDEFLDIMKKQNRLANEMRQVKTSMKALQEMMSTMSVMPNKKMDEIVMEMMQRQTSKTMENAAQHLQNQSAKNATPSMKKAKNDLAQILSMMQNAQSQMQKNMMQETKHDFINALQSTMRISQNQELLSKNIQKIPHRSPRLNEAAENQMRLRSALNNLAEQLSELSKKTLFMNSRTISELGKAAQLMENALSKMEEKNGYQAGKDGMNAMTSLNKVGQLLANSMDAMEESGGSSSGFQEYLKQLEEMSQQQGGLNQQTGGL